MNTPEALNGLAGKLIRCGLPSEYSERAVTEFADHYQDLVEELRAGGDCDSRAQKEAARRLGDWPMLLKKTVREYQQRHWCARWPLLTFILAPIPAYIAAYAVLGFSLILMAYGLTKLGLFPSIDPDEAFLTFPLAVKYAVLGCFTLALPAIVLYGFNRLARRAALGGRWVLISACILGLFIGMFRWERIGPNSKLIMRDRQTGEVLPNPRQPDFVILLPIDTDDWSLIKWCRWYMTPLQLSQLLLPAAAAATFLIHRRQRAMRVAKLCEAC